MNDSAVTPHVASKPDDPGDAQHTHMSGPRPLFAGGGPWARLSGIIPKGAATGQRGLVMQTPGFHPISHLDVRYLPPGEAPRTWTPGDFILVHSDALSIASLGVTLLAGAKLTFFVDGEFICSGLVARAMERTGAIFNRDPVHITPADLATYDEVAAARTA